MQSQLRPSCPAAQSKCPRQVCIISRQWHVHRHINPQHRPLQGVRAASGQQEALVGTKFPGRFGTWTLTKEDVNEVWGYRAGLSVTALAMVLASSVAFLPDGSAHDALVASLNPICLGGALGLGVALQLIHIYLAVLKRALQAFWLVGTCGGLYLMLTQDIPAALYVVDHPGAVWIVGPLFAALTGVAFKEWFCYNKQEAVGAFITTPLLMLTHLFAGSFVSMEAERIMLVAMTAMVTVFAARKYSQAIKDDIGDKSVFDYLALPPEEQKAIAAKLGADDQ